jgi:hypothetical protein
MSASIVLRKRTRVATDEMVGTPPITLRVADRIELVYGKMAVQGGLHFINGSEEGKDCGGSAPVQAWAGNEEFEP